jgi:hypothetical protein
MSTQVSAPKTAPVGWVGTGAVEGAASALISAAEAMFATVAARPAQRLERRTPPTHRRRYGYLEDAAMCREMRRL